MTQPSVNVTVYDLAVIDDNRSASNQFQRLQSDFEQELNDKSAILKRNEACQSKPIRKTWQTRFPMTLLPFRVPDINQGRKPENVGLVWQNRLCSCEI
jgi:hypothetical protein